MPRRRQHFDAARRRGAQKTLLEKRLGFFEKRGGGIALRRGLGNVLGARAGVQEVEAALLVLELRRRDPRIAPRLQQRRPRDADAFAQLLRAVVGRLCFFRPGAGDADIGLTDGDFVEARAVAGALVGRLAAATLAPRTLISACSGRQSIVTSSWPAST